MLVDGEPGGAVNRIPPEGDARANLHVGGRAQKATLSKRELRDLRGARPGAAGSRASCSSAST